MKKTRAKIKKTKNNEKEKQCSEEIIKQGDIKTRKNNHKKAKNIKPKILMIKKERKY